MPKQREAISRCERMVSMTIFLASLVAYAQPKNDSCTRPEIIAISSGGYGTGVFKTDTFNIQKATIAPGEYFHPDLVALPFIPVLPQHPDVPLQLLSTIVMKEPTTALLTRKKQNNKQKDLL